MTRKKRRKASRGFHYSEEPGTCCAQPLPAADSFDALHGGLGFAVNAIAGEQGKLRDSRGNAKHVGSPNQRVGQHEVAVAEPATPVEKCRLGDKRRGGGGRE